MYQDKITINPFPFIETIEDLQEVICSFGSVIKSEDAIEYPFDDTSVKIERLLYVADEEIIVASEDDFEHWLQGETPYVHYRLNYSDFAEYITSEYFLSGYYNNQPSAFDQLEEKAIPNFELAEKKLINAGYKEKAEKEFKRVVEYYVQHTKELDQLEESIKNDEDYENPLKKVVLLFIQLTKQVFEQRLLFIKEEYDYFKDLPVYSLLDVIYEENIQTEQIVYQKLEKKLKDCSIPKDFLSNKFNDDAERIMRLLSQSRREFIESDFKKRFFSGKHFLTFCYAVGIIGHWEIKIKKDIPITIGKFLNELHGIGSAKAVTADSFTRYYIEINGDGTGEHFVFKRHSDEIYRLLRRSFPKVKFIPPKPKRNR